MKLVYLCTGGIFLTTFNLQPWNKLLGLVILGRLVRLGNLKKNMGKVVGSGSQRVHCNSKYKQY